MSLEQIFVRSRGALEKHGFERGNEAFCLFCEAEPPSGPWTSSNKRSQGAWGVIAFPFCHNCLLLLCQLGIVLPCDILPGHRVLYPPIVSRVQTELVCLLSWHLYLAFNFLEVKKTQATQPSSLLCPALFKSALSLLAQLTSALQRMQRTGLQKEKSKAISATRLQKCGGFAEEKVSGEGGLIP